MARKLKAKFPGGSIIVIALIGLVAIMGYTTFVKQESISIPGTTSAPEISPMSTVGCPDTLATTIYTRHRNSWNTTEYYTAVEYAVYDKASGSYLSNITTLEGTGGTYTNTGSVTWCGKTLMLYPLTANNANSMLKSVSVSGAAATLASSNGNGNSAIELQVTSGDIRLDVSGHSTSKTAEARLYDDTNRAYVINENETSGTTWATLSENLAGITYGTTSAGGSAEAIASGGQLSQTIEVRLTENYQSSGELGWWVFVDAGTSASTYWNDFAISVNGVGIADSSDQMTVFESKRFSSYDYAFLVDSSVIGRSPTTKIEMVMDATANDPSSDIVTLIAPRGVYKTQAGDVAVGASKDDTSYSMVYSEWTVTRNIS